MKDSKFFSAVIHLILVAGVSLLHVSAQSQPSNIGGEETPALEIFTGFSYRNIERRFATAGNNQVGWNGSATYNLNPWLGLVADFGGHYGARRNNSFFVEADSARHTLMGGPRFTYRGFRAWTPFAHFLIGREYSRYRFKSSNELPSAVLIPNPFRYSDWGLALAPGGGGDLRVSDKISWRAMQADYLLTRSQGLNVDNLRVSTGIVFKIGKN